MHEQGSPSPWVTRFGARVAPGAPVLDVACGFGRHLRWFFERNHPVAGVDRSQDAINTIASELSHPDRARPGLLCADIENGPWPYADQAFGAVVVTNYLWRPLLPAILAAVGPGGMLIYETFAAGNETVGKPSRADFLLQPGELLQVCSGLRVIAYEDGFLSAPDRFVQRVCAVRDIGAGSVPVRWPLANP